MTSIKKSFKLLLTEISESAQELLTLSADLSLLSEINQLAKQILDNTEALRLKITDLKKMEFIAGIADHPALAELEVTLDKDAMSELEELFFTQQENQANNEIGVFLQEMLDKIEKPYNKILTNIEFLIAMLEVE